MKGKLSNTVVYASLFVYFSSFNFLINERKFDLNEITLVFLMASLMTFAVGLLIIKGFRATNKTNNKL